MATVVVRVMGKFGTVRMELEPGAATCRELYRRVNANRILSLCGVFFFRLSFLFSFPITSFLFLCRAPFFKPSPYLTNSVCIFLSFRFVS